MRKSVFAVADASIVEAAIAVVEMAAEMRHTLVVGAPVAQMILMLVHIRVHNSTRATFSKGRSSPSNANSLPLLSKTDLVSRSKILGKLLLTEPLLSWPLAWTMVQMAGAQSFVLRRGVAFALLQGAPRYKGQQTQSEATAFSAALQCAEGLDLYKLADFLFRGFNLARDRLATAPRPGWRLGSSTDQDAFLPKLLDSKAQDNASLVLGLADKACCVIYLITLWPAPTDRLAQYFLQEAKKQRVMSLTGAVVSYIKKTKGVGQRKAFMPPKKAFFQSLRASGRSKVQGPRSKKAPRQVVPTCGTS
eukprot:s312_g19.t1